MNKYWPLRFLLILFAIPAILACLTLANRDLLQSNALQHGILIQPTQQLQTTNPLFRRSYWNVFYLQPEICDASCQADQQTLNKLHLALGAGQSRVVIKSIRAPDLNFAAPDRSILIVDPQGWYVMKYEQPENFSGVLKDLRRLLKYSHDQVRTL